MSKQWKDLRNLCFELFTTKQQLSMKIAMALAKNSSVGNSRELIKWNDFLENISVYTVCDSEDLNVMSTLKRL